MLSALVVSLALVGQCSSNGACAVAPGYAPAVQYRQVPKYRLWRYPVPAPAYRAPYHAPMPAPAPRVYAAPQSPRIELYPDRPTTVIVPWPAGVPR
jgi:hypothetical protein